MALLLEQARPLGSVNPVHSTVRNWVRMVLLMGTSLRELVASAAIFSPLMALT